MNILGLYRRIAARLSPERRELAQLAKLPRGTPATSTLICPRFDTLDAASFAAQYAQIFKQEAFRFRSNSPECRILDCGANVGVFTVYCRQRYPEATIVAFEPDPQVFAVLKRNVERCCGGLTRVELIEAAVTGNDVPAVTFYADRCDAGRTVTSVAGATEIKVKAVRLRDYLNDPCDLLKIDIEGAEIDALRDCAALLGNVSNIFVEYHSFVGRPQRLDELFEILTRGGFRLFIQGWGVPPHPFVERREFLGMDAQLEIWGVRS